MRKTLKNFKDHVTPHQLSKGAEYFRKNKISRLRRQSSTGLWKADVSGREPYEVAITIEGGFIQDVVCDCIAHADDPYCKHVLAVLLAIEQYGESVEEEKEEPEEEQAEPAPTSEQIGMDALSKKEYVTVERLADSLITSTPIASDDLPEEIKQGFRLLIALAGEAIPPDMQERIYGYAYQYATEEQDGFPSVYTYCAEILAKLSAGKEEEVLRITDTLLKLKSYKYKNDLISRLAVIKLQLLTTLGRQKEIRMLLSKYPNSIALRDHFINEAAEEGDLEDARRMAEVGMSLFRNDPDVYSHFKATRTALFERFDKIGGIRLELLEAYENTRYLKYYRDFKATYEPQDWPAALNENFISKLQRLISSGISHNFYISPTSSLSPSEELARIYIEENDLPGLLSVLKGRPTFKLADLYTDVLLPDYPNEMLAIYSQLLLDYATEYKHADAIAVIASILKKMKKWKGGRKAVKELADDFTKRFSTRSKLLEMLAKI